MDTLFGQIVEILKNPVLGGDIFAVGKPDNEKMAFAKKIGIRMRDEILMAKRYHLGSEITKAATLLAYNVDDPVKDILPKVRTSSSI